MFPRLFLFLAWTILAGTHTGLAEDAADPVVGGHKTTIRKHPYQVSVQLDGDHWCGGSVVARTLILGAAHCYQGLPAGNRFKVRAGSTNSNHGGQLVKVYAIHSHPSFDFAKYDYDVAVLRLDDRLRFGKDVKPISLCPVGMEIRPGVSATVTGWGGRKTDGESPTTLRAVAVPIVSSTECQEKYNDGAPPPNEITPRQICAGSDGKDFCQGDAGDPLVYNGMQIGIASWGEQCGSAKYPGVYTKLSHKAIHDFIAQDINERI